MRCVVISLESGLILALREVSHNKKSFESVPGADLLQKKRGWLRNCNQPSSLSNDLNG
jgi:hypothetical protein